MKKKNKYNTKMYQFDTDNVGCTFLRVWETPEKRNNKGIVTYSRKKRIKCGDCSEVVEVYFDSTGDWIEINGVLASKDEWAKVLEL